ncbi:MAG: GNAT family N-acetyltransferase [Bacteroidia bacterium]|nr:GNAT family N-acetyltransferase [Bacteroidia bacterium]
MHSLRRTGIQDPDFLQLVGLLDQDLLDRYQELQAFFTPFNKLSEGFVVLVYVNSVAVACGCLRPMKEWPLTGEIKRMYTRPAMRGRGFAAAVVRELEQWAAEAGLERIVLETGDRQPEAIHVYRKLGYAQIENYGPYKESPYSFCMAKNLRP